MENVLSQAAAQDRLAPNDVVKKDQSSGVSRKSVEDVSNCDWLNMTTYHSQDMGVEDRIKAAFLDVLVKTPFTKIRMAEVAKMAGTSRQNIYRYFSSKEEIFRAAVDDLFDEFYDKATPFLCDAETDFSYFFIYLVYSEVQKHSDVFLSMMRAEADEVLRQQMRRYYRRFVGKIVRDSNVEVKSIETLDYVGDIIVGSTYELMKRWVSSGMKESPQQMARTHSHFFNGKIVDLLSVAPQGTK
ncbi:hypothetical protein A9Q99_06720 [Gammaproteobacteria bacterium 45_16_T64]|nr:hypothetical protein A9Q99_06720 [Gammaproteobacteria bacterium 45_16_T64]